LVIICYSKNSFACFHSFHGLVEARRKSLHRPHHTSFSTFAAYGRVRAADREVDRKDRTDSIGALKRADPPSQLPEHSVSHLVTAQSRKACGRAYLLAFRCADIWRDTLACRVGTQFATSLTAGEMDAGLSAPCGLQTTRHYALASTRRITLFNIANEDFRCWQSRNKNLIRSILELSA
jgi:hypothetical protein